MSHDPDTEQYITECIGPRQVGTVWFSGYDHVKIEVLAIDRNPSNHMLWSITERDVEGSQQGWKRTHCTAWDPDRDRVISQPAVTS